MKTLASICTIFLLLAWWPHSTHLSNPAIMYVDETPMPWTPIHVLLRSAALLCVAALWFLAIRSKRQS
jgi:hypothetical protein